MSQARLQIQRHTILLPGVAILLLCRCSGEGGEIGSATGAVGLSNCPTAHAGSEQAVFRGDAVTVNGRPPA